MRRAAVATILIAFLAMGLGMGVAVSALHKERAAHLATKAEHAEQREQAATAALRLSERNITLTKELTDATEINAQAQRELATERHARAADARLAGGRVRSAAKAYAATAGARCADPAAVGNEPTASEALNLLAGLLDRVAERTTALAEFADEAHARATACAADYDRAREALRGN